MFDRATLNSFKSMLPGPARHSAEAKQFLNSIAEKTKSDLAPFAPGDEHAGWQAYGNILAAIRGPDIAIIDLMFAYSSATRQDNAASFNTISAIAASLALVQTNDGRFDEQLAFLQGLKARYPGQVFATSALIKCRMLRGEIEHAEFLARRELGACSSFEMARDFVYWSYALFNHDDIFEKLPALRQSYPNLWRNVVAATALDVLQAAEKHRHAATREDASAVYCVNLPDDKGRWRRVQAAFGKLGLRLTRIDGVRADHLPMAVRDGFAPPRVQAGQVGCFLAHIKAWETSIARKDEKALIIEDDSLPMFRFSLAAMLDRMPDDADVVFVNLRSNPVWRTSRLESSPLEMEYIPIENLDPSAYGDTNTIGTDGYLISARGAGKLIALALQTKLVFHVDWHIFMACFRTPFVNKIYPTARTERFNEEVAKLGALKGYILSMPIIQELALDYSPRRILSS